MRHIYPITKEEKARAADQDSTSAISTGNPELDKELAHELNNAAHIEQSADHLLAKGRITKKEWSKAQKNATKIRDAVARAVSKRKSSGGVNVDPTGGCGNPLGDILGKLGE
jgi:predicted metal-binding transcription factor (methanogenesis marker protein 9)